MLRVFLVFTAMVWSLQTCPLLGQPIEFEIRPLVVDSNEGIAAGDLDGDGSKDLVAGRNWFAGGVGPARPLRLIDDWNGYVASNGDFLFDVNADGRLDVIAGHYMNSKVYWFENPGGDSLALGKLWPKHLLVNTGNVTNEGQLFEDLDGDGRPEWIVNSWSKDRPMFVWRLVDRDEPDSDGSTVRMTPHVLGQTGNGHGCAVGDLDGDGKTDLLVGQGWYEQPDQDPWNQPWKFHRDWDLHASIPMIVTDLDGDGDADLIHGAGHDYGLWWWEQVGRDETGKIEFREHEIDLRFSQPHALAWADLDGDGQPELITGKRYLAHNGTDPGGTEPPRLHYYTLDRETLTFTRHEIDEGRVGCGLQIVAEDIDGDGKVDLAVAGKSGTYFLRQR